jgi:hypothetical protein
MTNAIAQHNRKKISIPNVPDHLVRDEIDGIRFYYRNYKKALKQDKNINEIMGNSAIQWIIIEYLLEVIYASDLRKTYRVAASESGNNLGVGTNLAFDIAIYERAKLTPDVITNKYVKNIAPHIVIEVDIDISLDHTGFENIESYYFKKTHKLLEYGTQKVIWIFTESQKILVATNENWSIFDFKETIQVVDNVQFNINNFLDREQITLV